MPPWMGIIEKVETSLRFDSSPVDWCEPNYVHSSYVAEFFNTLSSVPICVGGLLHLWRYRHYCRLWDHRVKYLSLVVFSIGVGSIWFHMTLSIVGQLLDELFILWLIALGNYWYFPIHIFPKNSTVKLKQVQVFFVGIASISSLLCLIYPQVNHIALAALAIPQLLIASLSYRRRLLPPPAILSVIYRSLLVTWITATFFWVADKSLCPVALAWSFPYFHALWHLFSSIALCQTINMVVFCDMETSGLLDTLSVSLSHFPEDFGYFSYQSLNIQTGSSA